MEKSIDLGPYEVTLDKHGSLEIYDPVDHTTVVLNYDEVSELVTFLSLRDMLDWGRND